MKVEKELKARLESVRLARTLESGALVDVRDRLDQNWRGPVPFDKVRKDSAHPIAVDNTSVAGDFDNVYNLCRRHEVPALVVTFQPWSGGERPVSSDTYVLCRVRDGRLLIDKAGGLRWYHCDRSGDIVGWCRLDLPAQGNC